MAVFTRTVSLLGDVGQVVALHAGTPFDLMITMGELLRNIAVLFATRFMVEASALSPPFGQFAPWKSHAGALPHLDGAERDVPFGLEPSPTWIC